MHDSNNSDQCKSQMHAWPAEMADKDSIYIVRSPSQISLLDTAAMMLVSSSYHISLKRKEQAKASVADQIIDLPCFGWGIWGVLLLGWVKYIQDQGCSNQADDSRHQTYNMMHGIT